MSEKRMAGDALQKNKTLQERFGEDYVNKVKGDGLQDATNNNRYSRKELASEFRYGRGDASVDDTVTKYQGMVDSGEFKGNNKAQEFLKKHGVKFGGNNATTPSKSEESTSGSVIQSGSASGSGSGNSATNNSTINGNNNSVDQSITQNMNNSRNYGGDSRSFTYNGGKNPATDTPASMATMAGYYAPNDSASANASRLDRQVQQNTDIQKQLRESAPSSYIDPERMDNRIQQRESYSRAKAKTMAGNIFGDMFSMKTPEWNSAKPAKEVESPDFESMYNKYTDF